MHLLLLRCVLSFCPLKRLLRRRRQRSRSQEGFPWCVLNKVDHCIFGWRGLLIRPPRTFPIVCSCLVWMATNRAALLLQGVAQERCRLSAQCHRLGPGHLAAVTRVAPTVTSVWRASGRALVRSISAIAKGAAFATVQLPRRASSGGQVAGTGTKAPALLVCTDLPRKIESALTKHRIVRSDAKPPIAPRRGRDFLCACESRFAPGKGGHRQASVNPPELRRKDARCKPMPTPYPCH